MPQIEFLCSVRPVRIRSGHNWHSVVIDNHTNILEDIRRKRELHLFGVNLGLLTHSKNCPSHNWNSDAPAIDGVAALAVDIQVPNRKSNNILPSSLTP